MLQEKYGNITIMQREPCVKGPVNRIFKGAKEDRLTARFKFKAQSCGLPF